ncbi:calcium-binding protein [Bradyrhizobium sp. KB893862 SZCCT0404]|uniref:calcium-binding protein n=1 Tax=Bradyrhizobium sp. KB893862 SZCCT0404 TaxID=2807672 RepID=UPI00201174CE|nr:calcium-binding protein [Bradyrhizobium sp. KB893862 SZCCT0404]
MLVGGGGSNHLYGASGNDLLVGGKGNDTLDGKGGSDLLFGGADDDTFLLGYGGTDWVDGGSGKDTARFEQSEHSHTVMVSSANGKTPNGDNIFVVLDDSTEGVDYLTSVEHINLTGPNNTLIVKQFDTRGIPVAVTVDLGSAANDTADFSQYGGPVYLNSGSEGSLALYSDPNFGVRTGLQVKGASTILLTNSSDKVKGTGPGTVVHTGGGQDQIEASHNGQLLIEDASTDDRITFYGMTLTGGVQWGTESKYAVGSFGERYGRNAQGDLVVVDAEGNETFIPKFNFTTDASSGLTAGLFVIQVTYLIERSNGWTAGFETAASALKAMKKIGQALTGKMRNWTDPLVLDLDGGGVNLSSMAGNNASFDVDKDGFAERVGWVRGGDGMLVRDLNGNGKIDDIGEMFGNDQTPGFTQLASLDGNHDGKISALDDGLADFNGDGVVDAADTFATLKVWVDANEDGKTDAGELKSLASLDIVSISTGSTVTNTTDSGNIIAATGTFVRGDGTTGTIGEVQFDTDNTHTTWQGDSSVSPDAASRPDLKGFGTLTDLHVAMTLDADLVQTVDAALPSLNTLSLASLREAARTILYAWTGAVPVPAGTPGTEATQDFWFVGDVTRTGGIAYDFLVKKGEYGAPSGENLPYYGYASGQPVYNADKTLVYGHPTIDMVLASPPAQGSWNKLTAQDIAFLERYTGLDLGFVMSENPSSDAVHVVADGLTASWNTLNKLAVRLAAQGPLAPFFAGITYDVASDTFRPSTDHQLVPMLEAIFHAAPATASGAQDFLAQWHDIINVVLPDFQRDNEGHQLTDAFLFQNLVGAYEDVPLAISLQQAAAIFDIPASEIKTGSGTIAGNDTKTDLFYLDSTNQLAQGQGGSDAYIVGYNFGHDVIQDVWQGLGQNQEDSIWFSHLNVSDLTFTRDGFDLLITQNGTNNQIRVVDEFAGRRPGLVTAFQDFDKQIEIIKFADGTTWDQLDIAKAIGMPSYATDDNLIGTPDVDFLNGGAGTDFMSGGDSGDHYFFGLGYGHDSIEDREVWVWQASNDYVHFGAGISEDDVTFQRVGVSDDLQVSINGTSDVLTVTGQFSVAYGLLNTQQDRIEIFTFDDGSYIGWEDIIKALDAAAGTDGNDTITGFNYDDLLDGGAGNDFMTGGNGNDTYVFGRGYGSDTIEDRVNYILSGTDDTVKFKEGISRSDLTFHHDGNTSDIRITINGTDDSLTVRGEFSIIYGLIATMDDRIENFTFADGTVLGWHDILLQVDDEAGTSGNDTIYGFGYNDTLQGRAGDDYLYGGQGDDTYVYSRGDGHDTIYDLADAQGPEFDTLVLHGINPADVSFTRVNYSDVALVFAESAPGAGDSGSVVLQGELDNWFAQGVEQVVFDDGTVWTQSDLRVKVLAQASTPGNDTIVAFNTNDVIEGGKGDDTISGGAGDDTYIYTRGDGNDSIAEVGNGNYSSFDTLRLHNIAPGAVSLARNGNDLTLVIAESAPGAGDGGSVLLYDDLKGWTASGVEQIVFDDGTIWGQDYLRARVLVELTTDGNDTIYGFNTNDTLRGGKGDDILYGGTGDDTYVYSRGDGNDTIYEVWLGNYSSFDTLRLQNIAPSAVHLTRNGADMTLVIAESAPGAGDGGSILLTDEETGNQTSGVEQIVFDDGTVWTQADLRAMWLVQETASTDTSITGFRTDDTIVAGTVDRSLHGAGGRDTYVYSASGGNVVIDDPGHLQSELDFTDIASTDVSLLRPVANSGANLVITVNSTGKTITVLNEFTANGGLRAISFSDGVIWNPDQVKAVLAGGSGEIYVFNRGDGAVTMDQTVTSVRLGSGISPDDIILQANGRDLVVKLRGSTDSLTVFGALTANAWGISSTLSTLKFSDGTSLALGQPSAGHGLPLTFTWVLNTANFDMVGSVYGTNVYEVTAPGKLNFANVSAIGGTNIVKFDKGAQNLIVDTHNLPGSLVLGPQIAAQDVYWQTDSWGNLFLKLRGDAADSIAIWGDLQLANGVVTSAIKSVTFSDGTVLDTSHGPAAFTWLGNTANFNITGTNLGTNIYEVTIAGKINFADAAAAGGTNIVKFDRGGQALNVVANNFGGELDLGPNISVQDVYWQSNGYGDLIMRLRGDDADSINVWGDLRILNGSLTGAIKTVKFGDGTVLDMSHGPSNFTWLGNTAGFNITGTTFGTNVYEVIAANGKINFADGGSVGGINIVKYDKGGQALNVVANNFGGELDLGPNISAQDVYWQSNGYGDLIMRLRGDDADSINVWGDMHVTNGVVTSAIKTVKFSNGTVLDMSHGPSNFTWLGNTANFNITGTTFGTNIYEVTAANGKINFADGGAVGGINIVKYDKGGLALNVQANNFSGELDLGPTISAQDVYWQSNGYGDLIMRLRGDDADSVNFWGDLHVVNGVRTSAVKTVKFSDGTVLDMSHGPSNFNWLGNTANFNITGTTFGTNIYEVTAVNGKINFADAGAVGGINIVKFDKGGQALNVQANNFTGELNLGPTISAQDVYWQTNGYGDLILKLRGDDADSINVWGDLHFTNGVVTSAIKNVKFSDGTVLDMSQGPSAFTWIGTANNYNLVGSNMRSNVFEITQGNGAIKFGNASAGGDGNNTIKYDKGDGLADVQLNGGKGIVALGSNVSAQDVILGSNSAGDLIVKFRNDTTDAITIHNDLVFGNVNSYGISAIKFADGTTWDYTFIASNAWIRGTAGNDSISLPVNAATVDAGAGDDTFSVSGNGSDRIVFGVGNGHDVLDNPGNGYQRTDVLDLAGLLPSDVVLSRSGNQLIAKITATGETFTALWQFYADGLTYGIGSIKFADGTVWDRTAIAANAWVRGTSGNDSIGLPSTGIVVDGGAGDDTLSVSGTGADQIIFAKGRGHDTLDNPNSGYQRNDTLVLTDILPSEVQLTRSGNQLIVKVPSTGDTFTALWQFLDGGTSIYGLNYIRFADGTVWDRTGIAAKAWVRGTSGNDSITLPATNVTADAGAGDDTITVSGNGSDRIVFAKGYGHDTLTNPGSGYSRDDTLVLSDINPWEVQFSRSGDAMTLSVPMTGDSFRVNFQYWGDGSQIQGLTHIQFANGSNWSRSNLVDATSTFTWTGSAANATLTGNDYGANVFQFGSGAETAYGGARSNVYQVTTSTGQAQINLSAATGSKNEIDFLSGITDQNLWFEQAGNDLKIDLLGSNTSTTISNWFSGSAGSMQAITAGGLKIDSQISQLVQAMATYSANNAGFDPTSASIHTLPNDTALQGAVTAAWHA